MRLSRPLLLAAVLCLAGPAAQAQAPSAVPVPRERPADATRTAEAAPPPALTAPAPEAPSSSSGFKNPFNSLFGSKDSGSRPSPVDTTAIAQAAAPVSNLDARQLATLERVNAYFNSVQTLMGDFVQVGPDGRRTEGKFALEKPGKIRFRYAPPSPVDVIADGSSIAVRDRKLATQDIWPLSQTPLRFLLQQKIDLLKDTSVVAVYNEAEMVSVLLVDKSSIGGTSRLLLMFGGSDYQLKQWTVTDAQGADTSVAISNLDTRTKPDPKLFKIDYQQIIQ